MNKIGMIVACVVPAGLSHQAIQPVLTAADVRNLTIWVSL